MTYEICDMSLACLPDDHEGNAAFAPLIELDEKDALPSSKLQAPIDDVEINRGRQEDRLTVCVAVGRLVRRDIDPPLKIVVLVLAVAGRQAFEHLRHVIEQQWLVLVDDDRRGRVPRLNIDQ